MYGHPDPGKLSAGLEKPDFFSHKVSGCFFLKALCLFKCPEKFVVFNISGSLDFFL